ncbi:MAG TPA: phosphoribosylformylglycinamidine synthase, partial [Clostridiales bacterium]|nr:phosphoribosylformylglycinamidine synthase [Clostridiales bacterium]
MMKVKRIYVEKKKDYAVIANQLKNELKDYLGIKSLVRVRVLTRYDIENVNEEIYKESLKTIFAEPVVDLLHEEEFDYDNTKDKVFSVEFLAGQYDQREDQVVESIKLLGGNNVLSRVATTYVLEGNLSEDDYNSIKNYIINSVDSRETPMAKPDTLSKNYGQAESVAIVENFINMDKEELTKLHDELQLAMTIKDLEHIQEYYSKDERRNPSMTEIKVFDTYWSDHCRHTTFSTELTSVKFEEGYYTKPIHDTYKKYLQDREVLYKGRDKDITLMDIAVLAMKKLRAEGKLDDMEVSDEINACSIIVPIEIDGKEEEWLIFFKNETHNHPTEIEPFGGAATCLGGAIRDPLSGRGYVYQAMRITGAADPRVDYKSTLEGKLPQRAICKTAAEGYSSYGNQIGIAAGYLNEIYHPNFVAKRMELGAVMGAAPRANVKREDSMPGDIIILLGGRTGRDGIGGATGSSRVQTTESIETCGAEVQKGNPPTEKKIQRLFRRTEVSALIKKCNDFGAGGVSVAIGELADGLIIDLDKVPTKYDGLDGTELAISESQERMAVVVDAKDVDALLSYANEENVEATIVAEVTKEARLVILWKGDKIVNVSRKFLDTNGAHQEAEAIITIPNKENNYFEQKTQSLDEKNIKEKWLETLSDLNVCSQKGLSEMFDSSVGALSVTMPFGGKNQLTPIQTMIAKIPVLSGECDMATMMSYGYDPYLSSWSPFHGAIYAVISSVAKNVASGGEYSKIRLTFQEFFRRLGNDPKRWGEPLAALLGAYNAQINLELPSIGGKDSMSGTYHEIDVPPTLVSFAVNVENVNYIITPELKSAGNVLVKFSIKKDEFDLPLYSQLKELYNNINKLIKLNKVYSSYAIDFGGVIEAVSKMAFGNSLGVEISDTFDRKDLLTPDYGSIILELSINDYNNLKEFGFDDSEFNKIGNILEKDIFKFNDTIISMSDAVESWTNTLEEVYPTKIEKELINEDLDIKLFQNKNVNIAKEKIAKPTVFVPIFPGSIGEYEQIKAFENAGAKVKSLVFNNSTSKSIEESIKEFSSA